MWEHSPAAAKVYTWADETNFDTDLAPLLEAFGDVMGFDTWLERSGRARLLTQLEALPGVTGRAICATGRHTNPASEIA